MIATMRNYLWIICGRASSADLVALRHVTGDFEFQARVVPGNCWAGYADLFRLQTRLPLS